MPVTNPKSDFDRWENKEKDRKESLKMGEESYLKGVKSNASKKSKT